MCLEGIQDVSKGLEEFERNLRGSCFLFCFRSELLLSGLERALTKRVKANNRISPGNQLEALGGDRLGQASTRINQRYRICFIWTERGPTQVEIVDYH